MTDDEVTRFKRAIDDNNVEQVKRMASANPALHKAPLGYAQDPTLTWVAECRVPRERPGSDRLAMAQWLIENGSDVHQGGDAPLGRAALSGDRIPMMQLLVANGGDVNAAWHGEFPVIFGPCETVDPAALQWLLQNGADPNCSGRTQTALDYLIGSYSRDSAALAECIELLLAAGGTTKYGEPAILAILRGRMEELSELLDREPALAHAKFPKLDFGTTGGRMLTLRGATLLHVAAEYACLPAATLLLERGVDVNARAEIAADGVGGQTPLFHSATQCDDIGFAVTELLLDHGADLSVSARLPGYYENPGEILDCRPLEYAERFPGGESKTLSLLRRKASQAL